MTKSIEDKIFDSVEKKLVDILPPILDERFTSTIHSIDLIFGGGIPIGRWITITGFESSGKSALAYHILKGCLTTSVGNFPLLDFHDYETSTETPWTENIVNMSLDKLFGKKDESNEWLIKPRVRLDRPDYGQDTFIQAAEKIGMLPRRTILKGKKFLVFKENDARIKNDKSVVLKNQGFAFVPDNGAMLKYGLFIDSFPEMLPKALAESPDKSPMAQKARMLAETIPLVRSRLKTRGAILVGVNHVNLKPGVSFGNPEYTPCGEHLKYATDIRPRVRKISIPEGKGYVEEEVINGVLYRFGYMKVKTEKNKTFPKDKECVLRINFEKDGVEGEGIDPVYDVFEYLKNTKQLEKKRGGKLLINLPGPWVEKEFGWESFTELVRNPGSEETVKTLIGTEGLKLFQNSSLAKRKKLTNLMTIGNAIQKQIKSRKAFRLCA